MPTLNDVLAGSQAQAVQVQQIIDALKGTPNKGVPVALVSLNDPNNYALTVQNDDPTNSRALSVLKADGTTLISADATGVTLGAPLNVPAGALNGTQLANASVSNAKLGPDVARANLLTNGGFEIWQRGAGPFTANAVLAADMWTFFTGGGAGSITRETSIVGTGSTASLKIVVTTASPFVYIRQTCKKSDGYQLNGRIVSVSLDCYSSATNLVDIRVASDGTGAVDTRSARNTLTNSWGRLTVTTPAIPVDATFIVVDIEINGTGTVYLDNAMLVVGSQYADYAPMHPADDLARCLRYYERIDRGNGQAFTTAFVYGTTFAAFIYKYTVIKAVAPTVTFVAPAQYVALNASATPIAVSAISTTSIGVEQLQGSLTVASGLAAGNASLLAAVNPGSAAILLEANP